MDEVGGIDWWVCPEVDDTLCVEFDGGEHLVFGSPPRAGIFTLLAGVAHALEFFGHHGFNVHPIIFIAATIIAVIVLACGFGFLEWPIKLLCILSIHQPVCSSPCPH